MLSITPCIQDTQIALSQMRFAERFAVWASRIWIDAYTKEGIPCQRLDEAFRVARLDGCLGPLYAFLTILAHGARRHLDFQCPTSRWLGADERALLVLLASLQRGVPQIAGSILEDWLLPSAAREALYPARLVALGLAEQGFHINTGFIAFESCGFLRRQLLH